MKKVSDHLKSPRTFLVGITMLLCLASYDGITQASGFLYGKVYTSSNTYEGQIRWGKEEAFWTDYFNASKRASSNHKVSVQKEKKDESSWLDFDWDLLSIWENKGTTHQFNCQFGDIRTLEVLKGENALIRLKNGLQVEINGDGYNDLGSSVVVFDKELGSTEIDWSKIRKVEFSSAPDGSILQNIRPIYGTVETSRREKFTGFIQWDHDERISTDKLDGDSRDGKISAPFSEIVSIERRNIGCDVVFKSGRQIYIDGSNDVDEDNRGIIVIQSGKGMIDIPWSAVKKVTFAQSETTGDSYDSFVSPKPLSATVFLYDAKELSGKIIFDLDESMDVETLEGMENRIKYTIPFRNIKSVTPKNEDYSMIELRNGESLLLGSGRDVSYDNDGVLVFINGKKEPAHLRWRNIEKIIFD